MEVSWGEQSWEEMLVGFMNVAVDPESSLRSVPTLSTQRNFRFSILKPQPDRPKLRLYSRCSRVLAWLGRSLCVLILLAGGIAARRRCGR